MTHTFTMDFHQEFEVERARWLRKRVMWYCGVLIGWFALQVGFTLAFDVYLRLAAVATSPGGEATAPGLRPGVAIESLGGWAIAATVLTKSAQIAVLAVAFSFVRKRAYRQNDLLSIVSRLILAVGLVQLASEVATMFLLSGSPALDASPLLNSPLAIVGTVAGTLLTVHFVACLFIPWTPRESLRPMIVLLAVAGGIVLGLSDASLPLRVFAVLVLPFVILPGALVAWFRHSRFTQQFKFRMLSGRYGEMKQELSDARRIHEVLFPAPIRSGPVLFDYRYEPMRQIGGDYLYVHRRRPSPGTTGTYSMHRTGSSGDTSRTISVAPPLLDGPMSMVLLDVTGHGISAALTVNRIHGELERLFGEDPDRSPGETLCALNHYINVALARHSVFATALCIRIDPAEDRITWANGGHPPAFITSPGGYIDRIEPTTFILGACPDDEFTANERERPFEPGDVIVAYTDGVTETRNFEGRMLRTEGMQWIMSSLAEHSRPRKNGDHVGIFAEGVLAAVREYRAGGPADDTLVVEIARAIDLPANAIITPQPADSRTRATEAITICSGSDSNSTIATSRGESDTATRAAATSASPGAAPPAAAG